MALVLTLSEGDEFNIGFRRYRLSALQQPTGCAVSELGGETYEVGVDAPVTLPDNATLQEGLRHQQYAVRLMIATPKHTRVWRGTYKYDASVALLAPVPEEHLISGCQKCSEVGRVAFGSRDFEVFRKLDEQREGAPCKVLIYASWQQAPNSGPSRVTWTATYLRTVEARPDGSPPQGIFRPESTSKYPADNKGHWAVYWEVTDIRSLEKNEWIGIASLRGRSSAKNYNKTFRPERPLIIEGS